MIAARIHSCSSLNVEFTYTGRAARDPGISARRVRDLFDFRLASRHTLSVTQMTLVGREHSRSNSRNTTEYEHNMDHKALSTM